MNAMISRRQMLTSTAALTALAALPAHRAFADSPTPLTVERRTLEINGKSASVFGISQANGTAGLFLDPGQRFHVDLQNRAGTPTILHWHGQTPPAGQDGETDTGLEALIANAGGHGYDFTPRPGTHWMHSHQGLQEQLLMAAPLIIRRPEEMQANVQEVVILLQDFSFRDPKEIFAGLTQAKAQDGDMHDMPDMDMHGMNMPMPGHKMPAMTMDINDVDYDAYLANDRTLDDPQIVRVEANGLVRLRLINGASWTAFWVDLGEFEGQLVAVDGDPVEPLAVRRFPMAEAQRVDVLMRLPKSGGAFPVLAQREGDRPRSGVILATSGATIRKLATRADKPVGAVDLSYERSYAPPRRCRSANSIASTASR